jgi:alkaline phosphatase D
MTFGISIDFASFARIVPHVVAEAKPVLIRGRHGIGKSEIVYQIADQLGLPVVERRASQMTEGDLVGLPSIDGNRTSFNPPDWFKQACEAPVVLFLDEVDRAVIEVRQGIFELTDSRKLNGHVLHPDTRIFAAVNGGKHAGNYQVGEMDPAELDRWTVFDVEPTVQDWMTWAKGKVHDSILSFIHSNQNHLEHVEGEFEPNKKYPSRRSWKRCSDVLQRSGMLETVGTKRFAEVSNDITSLAAAFIGTEAAIEFAEFCRNFDRQVTPEDIINDGDMSKVETFGLNEHVALITKMSNSDLIKEDFNDTQVKNVSTYFMSLPSEAAMKLWGVLGVNRTNTIKIHKAEVNGKMVKNYIVSLLAVSKDSE